VITGAYSIGAASNAVNGGTNTGAPALDFFGNPRPATGTVADIGAVEFQPGNVSGQAVVSVTPSPLAFGQVATGSVVTRDLTVVNNGGAAMATLTITGPAAPFARSAAGAFPVPNCGTSLAAGAGVHHQGAVHGGRSRHQPDRGSGDHRQRRGYRRTVALVGELSGGRPQHECRSDSAELRRLGGCHASPGLTVTVLNTGNVQLTGLPTPPAVRASPRQVARSGRDLRRDLDPGASCTVNRVFTPTSATTFNGRSRFPGRWSHLTLVQLQGSGVAGVPPMVLTPNPLTITLPSGVPTGTGAVTLKNNAAGRRQVAVTAVTVAGADPARADLVLQSGIGRLHGCYSAAPGIVHRIGDIH
jgi:hypothetical protein